MWGQASLHYSGSAGFAFRFEGLPQVAAVIYLGRSPLPHSLFFPRFVAGSSGPTQWPATPDRNESFRAKAKEGQAKEKETLVIVPEIFLKFFGTIWHFYEVKVAKNLSR